MDFSADSRVLQSNCGAYELLFSDVATGRPLCILTCPLCISTISRLTGVSVSISSV